MDFEIRTWNVDRAAETINALLPGRTISLDETFLDDVHMVTIEKSEISDGDPIPEENYDGGRRDQISLKFEMKGGGKVTRYFEPINEACTVHLENEDLLIISIIPLQEYAKKVKEGLDERIKENEEFYSK